MTIQYVNFPSYKPWPGPAGGNAAPTPPAVPALNQPPAPPIPGAPAVSPPAQNAQPGANQPLPGTNVVQPGASDSVPAPNGVVAPDNWIPGANNQQPAPNQPPAGYPTAPQSGFSGTRALGYFFKGFLNEGVDMVKGAIQHPIQTVAIMAAGAAACFFLPWAGMAMTVGFAALGAFKMFKGWQTSKADRAAGNFAKAEQDFDTVGRGGFDVALAIGPSLFDRWLKQVRGQGPHVGTGGKAPRGTRTKAPKAPKTPKTPKAPKNVDPPTVDPTPVDPPKPVKVRTHTRAPKPATEVTNIGKGPKGGRAHVGSAKPTKVSGGSPKVNPQEGHVGSAPEEGHVGSAPEAKAPKAHKPTVKKPTVHKPAVKKPAVHKPAVETPAKPAAEPPKPDAPVADKPVADKPVVKKAVADKPVAKKPAAKKPAVRKPKAATGKVKHIKVKPKADKPAAEVTSLGKKPHAGKPHVGSNPAAGGNPQEAHVGSAKAHRRATHTRAKKAVVSKAQPNGQDEQTLRTLKGQLEAAAKNIERILNN